MRVLTEKIWCDSSLSLREDNANFHAFIEPRTGAVDFGLAIHIPKAIRERNTQRILLGQLCIPNSMTVTTHKS